MSVIVQPEHVQQLAALAIANAKRAGIKEIKRELKSGQLSLSEALEDRRAGPMRVVDLLIAQPMWGRARAMPILTRNFIAEGRRVRDLTGHHRQVLRDACE